eukprot:117580_1
MATIFVKVKCEKKFDYDLPKPSHHPKNKDVVIFTTNYHEGIKHGIYKYNLTQNIFDKIHTYQSTFNSSFHGQFVDAKNELLYVFGGYNNTFGTGVFDLNTKIMNTDTESALSNCYHYPQST